MVIDASATTALCMAADGFDLVSDTMIAPVLVRSETLSALQGLRWRGEISEELASVGLERLLAAPIRLARRAEVLQNAWTLAASLGWAQTYDAEYVALAWLQQVPLLTIDQRLARRVSSLVEVRTPTDLHPGNQAAVSRSPLGAAPPADHPAR